jgi:hypothetical protein
MTIGDLDLFALGGDGGLPDANAAQTSAIMPNDPTQTSGRSAIADCLVAVPEVAAVRALPRAVHLSG